MFKIVARDSRTGSKAAEIVFAEIILPTSSVMDYILLKSKMVIRATLEALELILVLEIVCLSPNSLGTIILLIYKRLIELCEFFSSLLLSIS